jgi:hypothetical protein
MVRYQPVRRRLRYLLTVLLPPSLCSDWAARRSLRARGKVLGSGPAYSRYFKQIAKAVVLHRP